MSTSLLYHNQSLMGVTCRKMDYEGGTTLWSAAISDTYCKCSKCASRNVVRSGGVRRDIKLLPTGTRPNVLRIFIPRLTCRKCGAVRQVKLPFADRGKSYTRALARYVLQLCSILPLNTADNYAISLGTR